MVARKTSGQPSPQEPSWEEADMVARKAGQASLQEPSWEEADMVANKAGQASSQEPSWEEADLVAKKAGQASPQEPSWEEADMVAKKAGQASPQEPCWEEADMVARKSADQPLPEEPCWEKADVEARKSQPLPQEPCWEKADIEARKKADSEEAPVEAPATGIGLSSLSLQGLKARLKEFGLKVGGKKSELIARLQEHTAKQQDEDRHLPSSEENVLEDARLKAEEEARVQAEIEARQKAADEAATEEARLAAEQEARLARVQAQIEAKQKAEEEARVQAEIEAKQKAEEEDASAGTTEDVVEQHVTGGHSIDIDLSSMTVLDLKAKARELFRQASGQQRQILGSVDFAIARLEEDVARLLQPPVTEASSISTEEHQAAPEEKVPTEASSIPTEEHLAAPEEKVLTEASSIPTEEHSAAPEEKVPEKAESDRVAEVLAKLEALEKQAAPEQDEQYEHLIPSLRPPITSQSREEKGEWTVKGIEERAAARQKTNWFVDEPVEHKEPSTDLKDDFIAQPASWGDFDMEGRLKDVRWDILPPKRSSREQTHRSSRQYLFSNEGEPYFWREAMDKLGGVMIGVGSEQNYLMAGWARPELLILMDLNPAISQLHKAYRVGFELASTPDDFIKLWGDAEGIERMSAGAIEIYGDSQDGEDVVSMITGHPAIAQGLIGLCLRKMKEKYDNLEIPCYLNNQEQYSHIRNLYKTGRVLAILGDLTGTKTMADVSALARDAGLPIRVLYISNAMYQITVNMFDVPPELLERFRDNMLGLPFDEKSLVLHTVQSSAHVPGGMKVTGKNLVRQAYMSQALGQNAPMPSKREPGKSWIFHETRGVEFQEWLENGKKHKEEEERIKAVEG